MTYADNIILICLYYASMVHTHTAAAKTHWEENTLKIQHPYMTFEPVITHIHT